MPGAVNWRQFWDNLSNGRESVHFLQDDELSGIDQALLKNKNFIRISNTLSNKDLFDPSFFNYTPDEARMMNPEHRIFHECAWEALEDAGCNPDNTKGSIGVYAGAGEDLTWQVYAMLSGLKKDVGVNSFTLGQISNKDYLATLLSYKLNLKGPAIAVQSGCSTSLVAIHLACKSLLLGENRVAIAGGVSVVTDKQKGYLHQEGMIYSADGHCRAFDKDASGTISGEGAGVVILKRLKDALADNDNIHAIIKGSAINNDGNRKVGYTAPSVEGQAECIKIAQKFAKVEPETITYVENHGTGTRLGDPIEVEALNLAFNNAAQKTCAIGSVKTNMGHLDAAAGVAGLIKVVLSLKNKKIPPSLNYKEPNPEINFDNGPFYVNTELKDWKSNTTMPLRGAVSSFGIGGTNAHVILEEFKAAPETIADPPIYNFFTISAKKESALLRNTENLLSFIRSNGTIPPVEAAYTLQTGRRHFNFRRTVLFKNDNDWTAFDPASADIITSKALPRQVVFMFSGAGSQYVNMGRELYETQPAFRSEMDRGFELLEKLTSYNYRHILYPDSPDGEINRMLHSQPVIFLFGYALAKHLMSFGITPDYMIGHSIGEYIAACVSGVFSFEDAMMLVVKRGQLMDRVEEGAMLSACITEEHAASFSGQAISLAAVNAPEQVVFSGNVESVAELAGRLDKSDISYVKLFASKAGHSHMLDDILDPYTEALKQVKMQAPAIPFVSNLTGNFITAEEAESTGYWVRHMRSPVQFSKGIQKLLTGPEKVFIELGGGHSLITLLRQHSQFHPEIESINLVRHPKEEESDVRQFTCALAFLWSRGLDISWSSFYNNKKIRKQSLPTYSFEPHVYPAEISLKDEFSSVGLFKAATNNLKDWIYYPVWKQSAPVTNRPPDKACYLLLASGNDFCRLLRSALIKSGHDVVEVVYDGVFMCHSPYEYSVKDHDKESFGKIVQQLSEDNINVSDIIWAWPCDVENTEPLNAIAERAYFSLVNLVKVLREKNELSQKRITLITDTLQKVTGSESLNYKQSLALGLMNSLPQEYSVKCRSIDICSDEKTGQIARQLSHELQNGSKERLVALRGNKRWVLEYEPNLNDLSTGVPAIRSGGLFLITGGLGNVGFVLAEHLLRNFNAKLVLTGRKAPQALSKEAQKKLLHLKALGQVEYGSADVSDAAAFSALVNEIEARQGTINGVIHAAGNVDMSFFELIEDTTPEKTIAMFSPKVNGVENICSAFKQKNPDFIWATSSLASVLAGLSYGAYSSANLYMDYFFNAKAGDYPYLVSANLGEMVFDEEDVAKENNSKRTALTPPEICRFFEWTLSLKNCPVVLESVLDLGARIHKAYYEQKETYLDTEVKAFKAAKTDRPLLKNAYAKPETETEKSLVALLEEFFGIVPIGVEDGFFELGGDSLKAMVIIKRILRDFNVKLTLKTFFMKPSVRQMAAEIDELANLLKKNNRRKTTVI